MAWVREFYPDYWHGRFFRRLYSRIGLLVAAGMVAVCLLTWQIAQQVWLVYADEQLRNSAALAEMAIRAAWPARSPETLAGCCRQMRERSGLRLTVIDPSGNVLGESDALPARMENHAGRPEVQAALQGRIGTDRRNSASVGRPYIYVAVPMWIEGRLEGVVRVAAPVEDFARREASLVKWVAAGLGVALPLALLTALAVARTLAGPVQRVGRWAQRLATGDLETRLELAREDEVGQVAASLERMRASLAERIREGHRQRQELEVLLAHLEEGIIAVNDQGVVLTTNAAARALLGAEGRLVGWPLAVGLARGPLSALWSEAVASGGAELRRQVSLDGPGSPRTVDVTITRVREADSAISWLLAVRDITELARSSAMKADFVANASHELRTPVASIQAALETLQTDGLDAATRERFMAIIARSVGRLSHLTEDLMQLNRVESMTPEPEAAPVEAELVVHSLFSLHGEALRQKGAAAVYEGPPVTLFTDRRWLELILRNLIDNAVKFIGPGGRIRVRCRQEDDRTYFDVEDNGCGIPRADLDRVFERFYQVDKSRSVSTGGTGLGLAIVKHAVQRLRGGVTLQSEVGTGTKVTFWLPSRAPDAGPNLQSSDEDRPRPPRQGRS
jgi:two-component system phosphate regulon sensor histidine kinase PhoR